MFSRYKTVSSYLRIQVLWDDSHVTGLVVPKVLHNAVPSSSKESFKLNVKKTLCSCETLGTTHTGTLSYPPNIVVHAKTCSHLEGVYKLIRE
jgi:hypothetical protein